MCKIKVDYMHIYAQISGILQETAKKASEETFFSVVCERFIYGKHNHYRRSNRT